MKAAKRYEQAAQRIERAPVAAKAGRSPPVSAEFCEGMGMEVRPGYKVTEIGIFPDEWEIKPLKSISPRQSVGLVINPSTYFDRAGTIPLLVGSNVAENLIDTTRASRITAQSNEMISASRLAAGDLVTVRVGEPGVTAVVPPELDGCNCASMMIVRRHSSFDSHWLCAVMNSRLGRRQVEHVQYGTAQKQFNISDAVDFQFAVPSLPEQRAIAAALSDVDALLGGLERLIAKKRDLKQAAMQQLLTGQTRLPGFSGEWEVKRLGDLFKFSGGFSASRDQLSTEGHCYLHYGDIHGSAKTTIDTKADDQDIPKLDIPLKRVSPDSLLADGDVVFVDASEDDEGTSKHVVIVNKGGLPFISGLHTIVAKARTAEMAHEYLRYCFQTALIRQQFMFYAVGTKVSGISKTNIVKLTLPVPSVPEQTAIAAVLSDMDAELATLEARRDKTRALKQAMMQELLTGKTRLV
ncbi:MAG: restriction endonuclease subunit S [Pseudomonadota bacterium]|nr:restriction endonuclease subunit S [Pseudomonadota bacterium]